MGLIKQYALLKHKNKCTPLGGWSVGRSRAAAGGLTPVRVVSLGLKSYGVFRRLSGPLVWSAQSRTAVGGLIFLFKGEVLFGSWSRVVSGTRLASKPLLQIMPYLACLRSLGWVQSRLMRILYAVRSRLLPRIP